MTVRFIALLALLLQSYTVAASDTLYFSGQSPSIAQLNVAQQQALKEEKLLMVVLGADWCHDSQALMQQFHDDDFSTKLQQRFVIVPVDLNYFDKGAGVTEHYQQPTFYGTPTVMIINPKNGEVTNKADWQRWTNAASFNPADYQAYFLQSDFSSTTQPESAWQQQVSAFEQAQAERVQAGFAAVGPVLETYIESNRTQGVAAFAQLWRELGRFRNSVFNDVQRLRELEEPVALPNYPLQSWEQEQN